MLDSPWFWVHVTSLLFAYATFALAAMLGLTYVLQFKEIKKKHLGYFYERLPSLHVLDAMNSRAVAVGWLFLTIGVVVGGGLGGAGAGPVTRQLEPAGNVSAGSEDLHRRPDVGRVFLRDVCSQDAWVDAAGARRGCRQWAS